MPGDSTGTRNILYALMRDYLRDASGNLAVAQQHVRAGKWRAAAASCSIGSRLLLDLDEEFADESILLTRQRNSLIRDANQVRKGLWLVAQKVRRSGKPGVEVSKMLRSFVAYDVAIGKPQAAEA